MTPFDLNHICSTIEAKTSKLKSPLSSKLDKKFSTLKRKKGIPRVSNLNNDSIIFNYSHRALTEIEKMVWQGDYGFVYHQKKVDKYDVKTSFEGV